VCTFRETNPKRRSNIAKKSNYRDYKPELRKDFNGRCGYCNDHEGLRNSFYEIDHFVPKTLLEINEYADYGNLVFSCRYCNNSKSNKWPTRDRHKCNDKVEGFIDPCDLDYAPHFCRNSMGEIIPQSKLGKWMHRELKLYLRRHSILWQIEKLDYIMATFKYLGLHEKTDYKDLFIKISCHFLDYFQKLKENNVG